MAEFKWSHDTNENTKYWDSFDKLLKIIEDTDGPIVDNAWLDLEVTVIGGADLSPLFLSAIEDGGPYLNEDSSSLLYFLGLTNIPPTEPPVGLRYSKGRKTAPDIDLDFDDRYREQVIDFCRDKYGIDHVANIVTFSEVKAASAIRDSARILGYDYNTGNDLAKLVPDAILGVTKTLEECLATEEFKKAYEDDPNAKDIIDTAFGLEGVYRQTGMHAAGVVITDGPITDYVPIMQKGADAPMITQWTMGWIESNGLLKIDFLGLRNLQVIDLCLENIKDHRDIEIDIDSIPMDDAMVFDNLKLGNSTACFQVESDGMKSMMVELQPEDEFDIIALISLYRPGPMGSGMDKMYINRKLGLTPITYPHPCLEGVLERSKGIMIYQEDVLNVVKVAAGMDASEADTLRRIMGKKKLDKVAEYREQFVEGCMETNNISYQVANKLYSDIEFFAGYGFNLAHAASYAVISYQTAYLKFHYPAEYMAAVLSTMTKDRDRLSLYLHECSELGIEVLPPSVSESGFYFKVRDNTQILFGLSAIDGIGPAQIEHIKAGGSNYGNMWEFMRAADPAALNKKTIEKLISAGALDDLVRDEDISSSKLYKHEKVEMLTQESDTIGIYLSGHPLDDIWPIMKEEITVPCEDAQDAVGRVKLGGIISGYKEHTTKKTGKKMCRFTLEDVTGRVEVVVFPNPYASIAKSVQLENNLVGYATGTIKSGGGNQQTISINSFTPIDIGGASEGTPIILDATDSFNTVLLQKLYGIMNKHPGDSPVLMNISDGELSILFQFDKLIDPSIKDTLVGLINMTNASYTI